MKIILTIILAFLPNAFAAIEHTSSLRSAHIVGDESGKYSGSMEIPEFSSEGEREAFLDGACTGIERLFGSTVECLCTAEILAGTLSFDCDTLRDVTIRQNIIYTPSFNGIFSVALLPLDTSFGVGYCLDGFTITIEQAPMPLNVGDVCFKGKVKLDADLNSTTPLVTPSLESCTFTAGSFGECEACEPCTTSDGQTGFSVTCDFVEVAACVPLALPVSRSSRRVNTELFGEQIADGMLQLAQSDIDRLISEADAAEAAEQPEEILDEEPAEVVVDEPNESQPVAAEPTDKSEKETSKEKKAKKSADVGDEELDEKDEEEPEASEQEEPKENEQEEPEEPEESVTPDWGEPNNADSGRTSFWNKMWPF